MIPWEVAAAMVVGAFVTGAAVLSVVAVWLGRRRRGGLVDLTAVVPVRDPDDWFAS